MSKEPGINNEEEITKTEEGGRQRRQGAGGERTMEDMRRDEAAGAAGAGAEGATYKKSGICSREFLALNVTQFLGAFNDNGFKISVTLFFMSRFMKDGQADSFYVALATALFIVPFILFSTYCGYLADKFSKRTIIVVAKYIELGVMLLGLAAFFIESAPFLFLCLFLMGAQSTVFGPAKYGILPESVPPQELSRANGYLELATFISIILGTVFGSFIFSFFKDAPYLASVAFVAIAAIGIASSHFVARVPAVGVSRPLRVNFLAEVASDFRRIAHERAILLVIAAITYFWFVAAAVQNNILIYAKEMMRVDESSVGIMLAVLSIGIGLGSGLAGKLSGEMIEFGLVPLGAVIMSAFMFALQFSYSSMAITCAALFMIGLAGGLFIVPLDSYVQQRAPGGETGRILGLVNFTANSFIVFSSLCIFVLHDLMKLTSAHIFTIISILTMFAAIYIIRRLPDFLLRLVFFIVANFVYRIKVSGESKVPFEGPALIVSNHVTLADSFVINAVTNRHIRFMLNRYYYDNFNLKTLFGLMKVILLDGPEPGENAVAEAKAAARAGHVVGVYPEFVTNDGDAAGDFKIDLLKLAGELGVDVIPVRIEGMRGSFFSPASHTGGRLKLPGLFRKVNIVFGPVIKAETLKDNYERLMEFYRSSGRKTGPDCN